MTIGMADGGNELGMGSFLGKFCDRRLPLVPGTNRLPIATDHTIIAGVSNWAAYALAATCAALRDRRDLLSGWNVENQRTLIETLVRDAGASMAHATTQPPSMVCRWRLICRR